MRKNRLNNGKNLPNIQSKNFHTKKQSGFVSIFAIFFSAIIVSVLTAIYILLVKQIELMNFEYYSFQSLYVADSAFECMILKEQNATDTNSVLYPGNILGSCGAPGDMDWITAPAIGTGATLGRSISRAKFSMNTDQGDFCAIINSDKETRDFSQSLVQPKSNTMTISGRNQNCSGTETRVVERLIEFFF